jgi:hypothetical protein
MGILNAPPRTEFKIVAEGTGRIMGPAGAHDRSKFWLQDDGTLVLAVLVKGRVDRQHYRVTSASFDKQGRASFDTPEGRWNFNKAPCACGYGSLAYAKIVEGRVTLTKVRPPEWVTGL